mmetsp:Transcript_3966/g.9050  ORF Transcript_3966/g.9050 Transcript_3966/m.9050 type:complete len:321 (-) Transcript_3966:112-1074(-)
MSLKLYIHWEEAGFDAKTSKIQIPKSWQAKTVKEVIALFAKPYNNAYPDKCIEIEEVHLETAEGGKVYSDAIVGEVLEDRFDYHVKPGRWLKPAVLQEGPAPDQVRCRNYGCNQFFREGGEGGEGGNGPTACQHHTGPPIFHDTMKCWSCCRDRKAYDFETFQLITGCSVGPHSAKPPAVSIAASPNTPSGAGAGAGGGDLPPPQLKSIADYNTKNPDAASAASSAAKVLTAARKSSRSADGLTAKCQRKGCQQTFALADNVEEGEPGTGPCVHHRGNPVFHDAVKFWSCCPDIKCYDFDEFLAVRGCARGLHDDGEIDL